MEQNGIFCPTEAHLALRAKQRRVIWQLDSLGELEMRGMRRDAYQKFIFGYIDRGAKVDSIFLDTLYTGDFYALYKSAILPWNSRKEFTPWQKCGFDVIGALTQGAKVRGVECILVHRIAEVMHGTDELSYAEKYAHPDWSLKDDWHAKWIGALGHEPIGLLNIANPEVQNRKIAILEEVLRKYEFSGLEIDLLRHTPFLPVGQEWELRGYLTKFLVSLRRMLDGLEAELGHPFLLSVRVGETLSLCRQDGMDVETWISRNIVDSITAGGRSFYPDLEGFKTLIDHYGYHQQLYPTIDFHHATDGYACPPMEVWRGVVCDSFDRGADGIKLFNWWTAPEDLRREIGTELNIPSLLDYPPNAQDEAMAEFSDVVQMQKKTKTHVAERRGGYPWCQHSNANAEALLPMEIGSEGNVRVYSCDKNGKRVTLTLVLTGDADIRVSMDGCLLTEIASDSSYIDNLIPPKGVDWVSGYRPDKH